MPRTDPFTTFDWIGVTLAGLATAVLMAFALVSSSFERMFADFGAPQSLPLLTQWVIQRWFGPLLAIVPATMLAIGLRRRVSLGRRRLAVVLACFTAGALIALSVWGLYWPIFRLARAIQ